MRTTEIPNTPREKITGDLWVAGFYLKQYVYLRSQDDEYWTQSFECNEVLALIDRLNKYGKEAKDNLR